MGIGKWRGFAWILALLLALFWGPWLYFYTTTKVSDLETVAEADVAIVFGALVRNGAISPLHEERLLSAKALSDNGFVEKIVVSNSARAAGFMRDYLVGVGLPDNVIEVDGDAVKTSDTCVKEHAVGNGRSVAFVSQSFHLPRIAQLCAREGVYGQFLGAEKVFDGLRVEAPLLTKIRVRGGRYVREAALTWSALLGVYDY